MPRQIVVLDARPADVGDMDWSPLRALGELTLHPNTAPDELAARLQSADIVLTNKVALPASAFEAAPNLGLVSVLATGYDVIDLEAARRAGVTVCNVPAYSTASTAQTTVALLLELTQHAGAHDTAVKAGDWTRSPSFSFWNFPLTELDGKTLLVVGLGAIGGRVAAVCEALGMKIIAAQLPGRRSKSDSPYPRLPLDEALPRADVVSLHCPATPETRGLVNGEFLSQLKPSAFLINTARGVLIDEIAVAEALQSGKLAGFAADVLSVEPPPADNPLLSAPNCILTPHIAWASTESRRRLLDVSAKNIEAFLDGRAQNVVS
ncbi:MAG: D-2-hydroxyacid dehydrogenase [Armatimonadetes bacterium]|nr:D-2-hydroxyacid dehydrogenase [Armatimonadota bacterium]